MAALEEPISASGVGVELLAEIVEPEPTTTAAEAELVIVGIDIATFSEIDWFADDGIELITVVTEV